MLAGTSADPSGGRVGIAQVHLRRCLGEQIGHGRSKAVHVTADETAVSESSSAAGVLSISGKAYYP